MNIRDQAEKIRLYQRVVHLGVSPASIAWRVLGFHGDDVILQATISGWISRTPWWEFQRDLDEGTLVLPDTRRQRHRAILALVGARGLKAS